MSNYEGFPPPGKFGPRLTKSERKAANAALPAPTSRQPARGDRTFDQFLLSEQLGFAASAQAGNLFRILLNHGGKLGEGLLATKACMRMYHPDWKPLVTRLEALGYLSFTGAGHALARIVHLTDTAKELLAEKQIEAENAPTE
jgi:hypothetical protein